MAKSFPDLNKDGEVTRADILKGRGVEMKKGGSTSKWIQSAIKKPGALKASMGVKKGEKIPANITLQVPLVVSTPSSPLTWQTSSSTGKKKVKLAPKMEKMV